MSGNTISISLPQKESTRGILPKPEKETLRTRRVIPRPIPPRIPPEVLNIGKLHTGGSKISAIMPSTDIVIFQNQHSPQSFPNKKMVRISLPNIKRAVKKISETVNAIGFRR